MLIRLTILAVLALLVPNASAQGAFMPRDADEEQAWRLYNQYKESKRLEAELDAAVRAKYRDAFENAVGSVAIAGVDWEANKEAKEKAEKLAVERKRQADLLAAWEKKYYWRYGDLRWSDEKIYDARTKREMSRTEFALIYFPFNYVPGKLGAPEPAGSPTQGTFTAEKGSAESWAHLRVTVGSVANFKTVDRPGWRNNGTAFSAVSIGTDPVTIRIDMTGKAGISYSDYTTGVSVKASDGKVLLAEQPGISKDGGSKSYSLVWDPDINPGSVTVNVSIAGGNPEAFINFVAGTISVGRVLTASSTQISPLHKADTANVNSLTVEYDTDRPGGDYRNFDLPEANFELCRRACAADANCKAYTYVAAGVQGPKSRCWLKSSVAGPSKSASCISGIKR